MGGILKMPLFLCDREFVSDQRWRVDMNEFYEELKKVDARIGKIVQAVKDAGIANETVIIVTADHGGKDKGHGGKSLDEVLIPWVVYGKGVKKNQELKNTVITYDTGATIAWLLGLKMPESWRGLPVKQAFLTK